MSISKILIQQARVNIFEKSHFSEIDIKGWIANQGYFIDNDLTANEFILRNANKEYLTTALANDCNRMSLAAIESICGVQPDVPLDKSGAWGVIRAYYASFFSAHAIMRIFGISCSQLDNEHTKKIFEVANALNKTGGLKSIENGFYRIEIDKNFEYVKFTKYKDSHRDTWGCFLELIDDLTVESQKATGLSKHKIEVYDILTTLKSAITRSRCKDKGNWLSVMRNSVNYQHSHGLWYPHKIKSNAIDYISAISEEWKKSPIEPILTGKKSDIDIFFETCLLINAMLRDLISTCHGRANKANPIFTNGCLRLLNTLEVV